MGGEKSGRRWEVVSLFWQRVEPADGVVIRLETGTAGGNTGETRGVDTGVTAAADDGK